MLSDLRVVLFFVGHIVGSFEKIFMNRFVVSCVIIYRTTIIPNAIKEVANCIQFKVVEN